MKFNTIQPRCRLPNNVWNGPSLSKKGSCLLEGQDIPFLDDFALDAEKEDSSTTSSHFHSDSCKTHRSNFLSRLCRRSFKKKKSTATLYTSITDKPVDRMISTFPLRNRPRYHTPSPVIHKSSSSLNLDRRLSLRTTSSLASDLEEFQHYFTPPSSSPTSRASPSHTASPSIPLGLEYLFISSVHGSSSPSDQELDLLLDQFPMPPSVCC